MGSGRIHHLSYLRLVLRWDRKQLIPAWLKYPDAMNLRAVEYSMYFSPYEELRAAVSFGIMLAQPYRVNMLCTSTVGSQFGNPDWAMILPALHLIYHKRR